MLKVSLEIDNHTAHSCSPLEYLRKYILQDAENVVHDMRLKVGRKTVFRSPYAKITVKKIEQI